MRKLAILYLFLTFNSMFSQNCELNCNPDSNSRKQILTNNFPNAYSCFLEMGRGWSGIKYGTGMLIHPRVLLTAGHNTAYYLTSTCAPFVFSKVNRITAYFGSIDSSNYIATATVGLKKGRNKFHNNHYWLLGKIDRDFSIVILPDSSLYKKIGGCYKIAPLKESDQLGYIHITGSPGDKPLYQMWTDSTSNYKVCGNYIKYDLYTEVRNSGSPIWIKKDKEYQIVGVHSRSYGNCNAAVFISNETYAKIKKWCNQAGVTLD